MGIRFTCHACSKRLNVKAFLAGKRGICPHCGTKVEIPWQSEGKLGEADEGEEESVVPQSVHVAGASNGASHTHAHTVPSTSPAGKSARSEKPGQASVPVSSPAERVGGTADVSAAASAPADPQPATATPVAASSSPPPTHPPDPIDEAPAASWYVRPPSGGQYGPASGEIMRKWIGEGRVSGDSLVWREGWADWKTAGSIFTELGDPANNAASSPISSESAASAPSFGGTSPAPQSSTASRSYPRRRNSNSLAVILVVLLTLASLGLIGVLIAVVQFMQ